MSRYSYGYRRYLPVLLIVVVVIIVVLILASVLRSLFLSPREDTPVTQQVNSIQQALLDTSADRGVGLVVRGPIVADENFRSYRIVVTPSSRVAQSFTGYLDKLDAEKTLGNNARAYEELVHALHLADLDRGVQFEGDENDTRGICATGQVYEFSFLKDNETVHTLWTSTCNGSPGSLRANVNQLTNLFTRQIPDVSQITGNLTINQLFF